VGALMGWCGILLIILAVKVQVLGSMMNVSWCNATAPVAMALAFVLGFSERFFDGILKQLEDKVQAKGGTASQPSNAPSTTKPTNALAIVTAKLTQAKKDVAYDQTLMATGGSGGPYVWQTTDNLPAGLTLNPMGRITGTPTAVTASTLNLQVTDSKGATATQQFTLDVQA